MSKIILASASPRRRELLERIGVTDFEVRAPEVDENFPEGLSPEETVQFISREKAEAAREQWGLEPIIITADTMVFLDDRRLGKPRSEADALEMLTALQGRRHTVCTGVTVSQGEKILTEAESTGVIFRPAEKRELLSYIATGEPMDKAGAYGIQGRCAAHIEKINGDYNNVVGLPVGRLYQELKKYKSEHFSDIR